MNYAHMANREKVRRELYELVRRVAGDVHLWHTVHGSTLDEAEKIAAQNGMDEIDVLLDDEDLLNETRRRRRRWRAPDDRGP